MDKMNSKKNEVSNSIEKNFVLERYSFDDNYTDKLPDTVGLYINEISKYDVLSVEEEKELFYKLKNENHNVREKLINHNLKLVMSIAKRYTGNNVAYEDLIQEGNIGLMIAIEKFDVTKGYKFSTYATWWIEQKITRYIADKSREIRIPGYLITKFLAIKKFQREFVLQYNREPTIDEISKKLSLELYEIEKFKKYNLQFVSLGTYVGEDEETTLEDMIPSENSEKDYKDIENKMLINRLNEILNKTLTPREVKILYMRNGINTNSNIPLTLEEVGKEFEVTRERIRQIEGNAIKKLKNGRYKKEIREIFDAIKSSK